MRKIVLYIVLIILSCFLIPIIFTNTTGTKEINGSIAEGNLIQNKIPNEVQENQKYDYKQYNTIKLLDTNTGEVKDVELDEYLYGVVAAEMPATFELEALRAQAVVARTYTVFKITTGKKHENADICTASTCCQAWISKEKRFEKWEDANEQYYWNKILDSVNSTKGDIITYEGKPINAFFHSNSGGKTEMPVNVWGGTGYPYLQVVETAGEDAYNQYASNIKLTYEQIIEKLKIKHPEIAINFENDDEVKILDYTDSGRVKTIKFGNVQIAGVEARTTFGLKSSNFQIKKNNEEKTIEFSVLGYGHGVGMSQTGADAMAKSGTGYKEIINHFYTGIQIEKI